MIDPVDVPIEWSEICDTLHYFSDYENKVLNEKVEEVKDKVSNDNTDYLLWDLVWKKRILRTLERNGLEIINEQKEKVDRYWKDILNKTRKEEFHSLFFELEIAALLSSFGVDVSFVYGSGERNAPDLLVNDDLWIECKKRKREKQTEKWIKYRKSILDNVVNKEVVQDLGLDNKVHSFTLKFSRKIGPQDIDEISIKIIDMIKNNKSIFRGSDFLLKRTKKSVDLNRERGEIELDSEFSTRTHGSYFSAQIKADENRNPVGYLGVELRYDFPDEHDMFDKWFYPDKLENRIKKGAKKNLSNKEKSAIFIGIPSMYIQEMVERQTPEEKLAPGSSNINQLERFGERVKVSILDPSETINFVNLYSTGIINRKVHLPIISSWGNNSCKYPDPQFSNKLEEIGKMYHGYLRSKNEYY